MIGLIQKAEMEIVLVDGYVDVGTLNILSKKKENVAVTVYTQQRTKLSQTDIDNFNAQYPKLDVKYTRAFHDRFLTESSKSPASIARSNKQWWDLLISGGVQAPADKLRSSYSVMSK